MRFGQSGQNSSVGGVKVGGFISIVGEEADSSEIGGHEMDVAFFHIKAFIAFFFKFQFN